ncbi:hypothetical protein EON80_30245 [bacterium]|nr:MAG: hypothetical protein EON80_30245 [bacterium]
MKEIEMDGKTLSLLEDRSAWTLLVGEGDEPTSFPCVMTTDAAGERSFSYHPSIVASFAAIEKGKTQASNPDALDRLSDELLPKG